MKFLITALLASASINGFADTVNVDFQSIEIMNDAVNNQGYVYTEDGYQLDNLGSFPFANFGTLSSAYKGSTALFNNTNGGATRLTKVDANAFTLNSIDLTRFIDFGSVDIFFTGIKSDSSTVSQLFTANGSLLTYTFIGFTDLVSVEWLQNGAFHQFDNINLTSNAANPSAVPVPAAAWLFGSAVLGFMGMRRRNQV